MELTRDESLVIRLDGREVQLFRDFLRKAAVGDSDYDFLGEGELYDFFLDLKHEALNA